MIEKTLAIIKPDAIKAKNVGKIIDRIEQENFNILNIKKIHMTKDMAERFYAVHKDKPFFNELIEFITSGPCITMILEKENAIQVWRDLIGVTDPMQAKPNTLRKIFGANKTNNAVHGSDTPETAKIELNFFFPN